MKKTKFYDFGFGTTPGIAEIFLKNCPSLNNFRIPFDNMQYPAHQGIAELVEAVHKFLKINFGEYKHVLITNGATHALSASLNAYRNADFRIVECLTQPLYYRFYPQTISDAGLIHKAEDIICESDLTKSVYVIASPSNPTGELSFNSIEKNTIFDCVYSSKTYCKTGYSIPAHEVLVGGINKLSGLTGVRIGWLATNSKVLYDLAYKSLEGSTCCVSLPSQLIALEMLNKADWDTFYDQSNDLLERNREALSKISYLFGNQKMPRNGMFAFFEVDQKLLDLFSKSNVIFTPGNLMGGSHLQVRINLAKTTKETVEMVSSILRNDKIV
jgi:aspartate/methionine/tyrosine aminotransferase